MFTNFINPLTVKSPKTVSRIKETISNSAFHFTHVLGRFQNLNQLAYVSQNLTSIQVRSKLLNYHKKSVSWHL